ncbi:ubiquinone/menaquinone biosynthesis C-methylase UbiE [Peribacillus deserti]|uniref:Ubiquinone/menaquinone biosynthesis C-methylase UbiE n=1 Tax=Peribacillus deserti TaxID=673318 RepID=A0ABS2QID9_9BACI|nr:class I SAM-dependent methyltransferase [Peribacillus deserti]MBM7692564.1 ubiquinone/menaquinone biosynthesis C-methylase UbiE [Peribacillus deserti]
MDSADWLKQLETSWDSFSDSWSRNAESMWEKGSRKEIIPFIKQHIHEPGKVCDLGCGEGYGSWKLSQEGFHVTGVDISKEMIDKANQRAESLRNLHFVQADIGRLPFEDAEFDGVMAINSFEWTQSPLEVLNESSRILKPGGYAIIGILGPTAAPRQAHSYRRLYGEAIIMNSMLPWEFEKLACENGWIKREEIGVEKKGAKLDKMGFLSTELKQALSFMWIFLLEKK